MGLGRPVAVREGVGRFSFCNMPVKWVENCPYGHAQVGQGGISFKYRHRPMEGLMSDFSLRDPGTLGAIAATALCIGGYLTYRALRKQPSEEELEQLRRQELVQTGRILDGTILDISDLDPHESGRPNGMQLILYKYEIAGVCYECSQ